jgi:dimethyladenosine transferase 1
MYVFRSILLLWASCFYYFDYLKFQPFYFPDHVGFSIGGPEDEVFYIMETHYDNPTRRSDMIDDSGIRITLTPTLRQHEAGMLELGHSVNYFQVIPPGLSDFVTKSYCSANCLSRVMYRLQLAVKTLIICLFQLGQNFSLFLK